MEGRPEAQMIAPGRPHLTLVPKQDPGKPRRDPMDVDGDRITTVGNRFMSAEGNVLIRGKEMTARSAEAFYDADQDRLELRRQANVVGQRYTLRADFVETTMKEGKVQRVLARTDAHLVSDKLTVDGPLLTLFFADDKLQRLVAAPQRTAGVAGAAAPATTAAPGTATAAQGDSAARKVASAPADSAARRTASAPADSAARRTANASPAAPASPPAAPAPASAGPRPTATATGFKLVADSLEAVLPNQELQTVYAVGRAHGESWDTLTAGPDGTRRAPPRVYRPPHDSASAARPNPRRGAGEPGAPVADSAAIAAALAKVPTDRDLVDADTIIGHFIQVDTAKARTASSASLPTATPGTATPPRTLGRPAQADTAAEPKTELDRMQAFGGAHALYRLKPRPDSARRDTSAVGRTGINYVIGDTIDLKMADGEVETAHVRGLERGIYLEPQQPRDTASRDSAAAKPASRSGAASSTRSQPPGTARANPPPAVPGGKPALAPPVAPAPTPRPPVDERRER
jgi:hypothetical protein